jgi:pyruvate/2-oxoglutarate/acetoin dehydrogenase E1 component
MIHESLEATRRLKRERIEVAQSARRTNDVVIAEERSMRCSIAWLAGGIIEDCFDDLDAPIVGPPTLIPFSPSLEAFATTDAEDVKMVVRTIPE